MLLRLACAGIASFAAAHPPFAHLPPNASMLVAAAFALAFVSGLGTRVAAFVLAAAALTTALMTDATTALTMVARACACGALGLLGPGAYSIDAKLFGRRVIRLEPRASARRTDD